MPRPMLKRGARGDAVRDLQEALERHGFSPDGIDGIFGRKTEAAVRRFQTDRGLLVDGIVGPQTWGALCEPEFDPGAWNDGGPIQSNNNCYNYACDIQNGTFAQPGNAGGSPFSTTDCAAVGAGAVADGLAPIDCDEKECSECCHIGALVIWPGTDFHWFRRDRDGNWTHKPGSTPARNTDNSGNIITDPRTADRGPYTVFCGCFCICAAKVSIG